MLIDGEKYACEACVRGHRVSTCQHSDRALQHINKKGRPVSQCPHCRGLRKARSSHVQCECGAKPHTKEECVNNDSKSEDVHSDSASDPGQETKICCCSHGMRCTCASKKEYLDSVPEIDMPVVPPRRSTSSSKPRLLKAGSDNSLTVFTNGHHKPVHKHNDSAHQCGLPYKIPIPHSVPSNTEYARRSTDSLPLNRKRGESHSQLHESISSAQQEVRLVRSEHGSPEPRPLRNNSTNQLPPLEFPYSQSESAHGQYSENYSQSPQGFDGFYTSREEAPALSAGMPPVDWSSLELDNNYTSSYSQPPSYASFEVNNNERPPLTTSSSGELSEIDDYASHNARGASLRPEVASSSAENLSFNRLSSNSWSSIPQTSTLSSNNLNSLDYETFLHTTASPTEFEEPSGGIPLRSEAFTRHGFSVHDVQKMAHPDTPTEAMGGLTLPPHEDRVDHVWQQPFDHAETALPCKAESDWQ